MHQKLIKLLPWWQKLNGLCMFQMSIVIEHCDCDIPKDLKICGNLRTHSGEETHKCTECSKSFSQVSHMRTHLQTQADEKLHKCTQWENHSVKRGSEKTSAGTLWREGSQVCKMREIIQLGWKSEDSYAHSQWREEQVCTRQQDIQFSCYLKD